jgi:hypothetical protein
MAIPEFSDGLTSLPPGQTGIDRLVKRYEPATLILQSRYQLNQVRQGTPQTIKSPCHEGVALFQRGERLVEPSTPTCNA